MWLLLGLVTFLLPLTECSEGFSGAISVEKRLIKQLMDNYTVDGKFGRPIKAMNETLKVGYGLSLVQIMGLNEKRQVLTTNVWCKYKWRDESLQWNPEEHDNITVVRVPIASIWKPDFVLYNYADERLSEHRTTLALIDPNGYITWIPPAIFKSTCFIDTTFFPFDEQSCHMKFGSWTYNGNSLDPFFNDGKNYIELSEYMPSQEWIILEHWALKNVVVYECCPNEPYPDLTFYLKLRRRGSFYSYTLILPCVLLSFMIMVLFMLPPETPGKMLLGINIFVAFFMLLLLLKDSTPPTAKQIPMIGAYYCFNMVMTTCSTYLCAIVVDMHFRADKRTPPGPLLIYIVIEVIARAMFFHIPPSVTALRKSQQAELLKRRRLAAKQTTNVLVVNKQVATRKRIVKVDSCVTVSSDQPMRANTSFVPATVPTSKKLGKPAIGRSELDSQKIAGRPPPFSSKQSSGQPKKLRFVEPSSPPHSQQPKTPPVLRKLEQKIQALGEEALRCLADPDSGQNRKNHHAVTVIMIETELQMIRELIDNYIVKIGQREIGKRSVEAWRLISMVLDRVFLFGYLLCMILSLTTLFPQRPIELPEGVRFPNGTLIGTATTFKHVAPTNS